MPIYRASGAYALLALGMLLTTCPDSAQSASSPWLYPSDQPLLDLTPDSFDAELIKTAPFLVVFSVPGCALKLLLYALSGQYSTLTPYAPSIARRSAHCSRLAKEWCAAYYNKLCKPQRELVVLLCKFLRRAQRHSTGTAAVSAAAQAQGG